MARVIFIDKLIRSENGHNLEYCVRQAPHFGKRGFDAVILGNSVYRGPKPSNVDLRPVIDFDFERFVGSRKKVTLRQRLKDAYGRWKIRQAARLRHSTLGIAYLVLTDLREGALRPRHLGVWIVPVGILVGTFAVLQIFLRLAALPIRWTRRVLGFIRASRPVQLVGWLGGRFASQVAGAAQINPAHIGMVRDMVRDLLARRATLRTAKSIAGELDALALTREDIVLWTTTTEAELRHVVEVLDRLDRKARGTWHFIMREPIFLQEHKNFTAGPQQRGLRVLLLEVRELIGDRARFWTDTPELSEQYSSLRIYEFGTLGIPVPEEIAAGAAEPQPSSQGTSRPIVLGYVGDARPEKGFGKIPQLVEGMAAMQPERDGEDRASADTPAEAAPPPVGYLVQTNFNVPGGVSITRAARLRLEHMDNYGVRTIDCPQSSRDYAANILATDVMLLNYDSPLYFAGSSGILGESLLAGRPVVVTDKTWGGRVVRNSEPYRRHMLALADKYGVGTVPIVETSNAVLRVGPMTESTMTLDPGRVGIPAKFVRDRWTAVPANCSHAIVIARFEKKAVADALKITLDQRDAIGRRVSDARYLSSELGEATAIVPLVKDVRRLRFESVRLDAGIVADSIELRVVLARIPASEPVAAVGMTLAADGDYVSAVSEVCKFYDHYRRTAGELGRTLRTVHAVEPLVEAIVGGSRCAPSGVNKHDTQEQ